MALDNRQLLLFEFLVCLVAWSSIAVVFVAPRLQRLDPRTALRLLIAPQMFRIIGMTLLANNVPAAGLDPEFARWVATGDCITSLLAIATFIALGRPGKLGIALAALTTVVGTVDMLHNLALGMKTNAAEHLAAGWFVVAMVVPLMLVAHVGAAFCHHRAPSVPLPPESPGTRGPRVEKWPVDVRDRMIWAHRKK